MTQPPDLTQKQLAIQTLIYRFRFLNRVQIQTILNHKDYRRINAWLKDLTEKKCIERLYAHTMPENTKPAIYYLGKNGRRWMSGDDYYLGIDALGQYRHSDKQLKKTYKDGQRTDAFRQDCLAIADCYITIEESVKRQKKRLTLFTHSEFHLYHEMEHLKPDLSFITSPDSDEYNVEEEEVYVLFYITNRKPKRFIRYRIHHIVNYFQKDEYLELEAVPTTILFVAANKPLKNYAKRVLERKLEGLEEMKLRYRFTTLDEFKTNGLYGDIWKSLKRENY